MRQAGWLLLGLAFGAAGGYLLRPATKTARSETDRTPRIGPNRPAPATRAAADDEPAPAAAPAPTVLIERVQAQRPVLIERGDGAALLESFRALIAAGPDAWPLAAELWVDIADSVGPASTLGFHRWMDVAGHIEGPHMLPVFVWALTHEAPTRFREESIYRLPWLQPPERTLAQFRDVLSRKQDDCVVVAAVRQLLLMDSEGSQTALRRAATDPERTASFRATVVAHLPRTEFPWTGELVRTLARTAPDGLVRDAARAALVALDPPVRGCLITSLDARGVSAGLRVGDIVTQYAGRVITTRGSWGIARSEHQGDGMVEIRVFRDGAAVTLMVPAGPLGAGAREVEPRKK